MTGRNLRAVLVDNKYSRAGARHVRVYTNVLLSIVRRPQRLQKGKRAHPTLKFYRGALENLYFRLFNEMITVTKEVPIDEDALANALDELRQQEKYRYCCGRTDVKASLRSCNKLISLAIRHCCVHY